jgi:NTE family protein
MLKRADRQHAGDRPKVGLVLGAGGVLGGAWMVGGLAALHRVMGWDPREADYFIGTSAGAVFAALLASGVSPSGLLPASVRGTQGTERWILDQLVLESSYGPKHWPLRAPLGSWRLALAGVLEPRSPWSLLKVLSGIAPIGRVSADPIALTIRRAVGLGWAPHPNCRIVATDYASGKRVVFGEAGAPQASLAEAVAASCAIPGFFEPVSVNGRRYVDGGLHSFCNLDLLQGADLNIVVCFSTLTAQMWNTGRDFLQRTLRSLFSAAAEQLDSQVRALVSRGVEVVVLEPTAEDRAVMGPNLMDARRCSAVVRVAMRSVARQLRRRQIRRRLGVLGSAA